MKHPSPFHQHPYLDFHTHRERAHSDAVMEIVSVHLGQPIPDGWFTAGLHPWWTEAPLLAPQREALSLLLANPRCLAMGEMGLDRLKGPALSVQMDLLRAQLALAQELHKPVVIHCVRAFAQLGEIKKEFPGIARWCIHGYGRHATLARQLTDQGFYLSLMPGLPPAKYAEIWAAVPHERLFLETDSAPEADIQAIYAQMASITGMEMAHLCRQIQQNASDFFGV